MKISTQNIYPPIPTRQFDWCAVDGDTYDGEGCPIGFGPTEQDAVDDLLDRICRDRGGNIGDLGECLACDAEAGECCRSLSQAK